MGLDHLHSSGICHRDLKLENTLVHDITFDSGQHVEVRGCYGADTAGVGL